MNIKVNSHTLEINQNIDINAGEYNITTLNFEFSDEYGGLTKMAVFSNCETSIKTAILDNQCTIPFEVLEEPGQVLLGVYGYEGEDDSLELRYSPEPQYFNVKHGSYQEGGEPTIPPKSEWEQLVEEINQAITETNNLNIEATKEDHTTTITITRKDGTSYDVEVLDGEQGPQGEPGQPGAIKMVIVETLPETGSGDTLYFVPKEDTETSDIYDEYAWVNNAWERLGEKQIVVDLTNYVTFDDYATAQKGGVVKVNSGYGVTLANGVLIGNASTYSNYNSSGETLIISKGTLENVITGKGLVSNTSYASANTGGVIKTSSEIGTYTSDDGILKCRTVSYQEYNDTFSTYGFISQGTLENVITGKDLTTKSYVDGLVGDIESILETLDIGGGING